MSRIIRHFEYLKPMRLYELARDTGKNMIGCDLGKGTSGLVLHLYGSQKVLPFRSLDPSIEPFMVLRLDGMDPYDAADQLNALADQYDAAGFYFGCPVPSRFLNDLNHGIGVREALYRIDQTGVLRGKLMTFVNENNSSKKAVRDLKALNPHVLKSQLKKAGLIDVFAAKTFTEEFLIKAASGTLYKTNYDIAAEDYLEWVADRMGIRRRA